MSNTYNNSTRERGRQNAIEEAERKTWMASPEELRAEGKRRDRLAMEKSLEELRIKGQRQNA